jgi:inner membrane protein
MDPVTHTLVGASLAESGLKRRTALGMATLLIAANLPDVDIASYFWGNETALWFRRGVTHGVLAIVLFPLVLTGAVILWDRTVRRRKGRVPERRVFGWQILLLSYIGVASHPLLDFLNVYGMRWLMPFSDKWYYGDTLFIVDPWVWAVLVSGIVMAKKQGAGSVERGAGSGSTKRNWTVIALSVMATYVILMAAANVAGRAIVVRRAAADAIEVERTMVGPVPFNPFARQVVVEDAEVYRFGALRWFGRPMFVWEPYTLDRLPDHPAVAAAIRGPRPRKFMSWARFPYFEVESSGSTYTVHIGDARYTLDPANSWAATTVLVGGGPEVGSGGSEGR